MSDAKKRKKAYYVQASKAKKAREAFELDAGMRGFLITCNNAEKKAIREAYNIFNEYADKMYGCEKDTEGQKTEESDEDDFESAIREEVAALKNNATARRFQVVDSKANNCIFIKTTLEHPDELVTKVFNDLLESRKNKSRFILRLLPVLGTCRAAEDKIEKLTEEVVSPFLADAAGLTFCVIYKVRCNNTLGREAIIQLVARVVSRLNPLVKVKFDDPDLVISVDVLQKICCLSVLKNFNKFKKYNVQEINKTGGTSSSKGETVKDAEEQDGTEKDIEEQEGREKDTEAQDGTEDTEAPDAGLSKAAYLLTEADVIELQGPTETGHSAGTESEAVNQKSSDLQDEPSKSNSD